MADSCGRPRRFDSERALAARLTRAQADRLLPPETGISASTGFYDMLIAGLSGLAKQGAFRKA